MLLRPPISTLFPYTTLFRSLLSLFALQTADFEAVSERLTDATSGFVKPYSVAILLILRSEEHTSELQSLTNLVCRLLLEKKKKQKLNKTTSNHQYKIQLLVT